jgi:hypothetical protein
LYLTRKMPSTTTAATSPSRRAAYQPAEKRVAPIAPAVNTSTARASRTTVSQTSVTVRQRPALRTSAMASSPTIVGLRNRVSRAA